MHTRRHGQCTVEPVDEQRSWFSVLAVDSGSGPPPPVHRPAASLFDLLPAGDAALAVAPGNPEARLFQVNAKAGTVLRVNWNWGANGNCIEIQYGDGTLAKFLHLSENLLK